MTFIPDHFSSQLLANENVLTIKQNEIILPPILLLLSIYLSTFGLVFTILFLFLLLPVAFYICHCYVYKGNKIHSHFYVSWAFSSFFILLYVFECIVVPFLEITIWENYTLLLFLTSGLLIIFYIRHQIKHNINLSEKVDSFQFYNLWISSYIYTKYLKLYLLTLLCLISALTFGAYLSITTVCQTHLVGTFLLVPDDCSEVYFDTNLSLSFVAALYSLMLVIMLSFSLFSRLLTFVGSRPSYHPSLMFGYPPSAVYSLTGTINLAPQLASVYSHRMSKSNQLSVEIQNQLPPISPPCRSTNEEGVSSPRYNKFAEIIRKSTNSQLQCSMFCGGRKCKYDSPTAWAEKDRAIPALFSHWITNDILAMSRPTTEIVEQFDLISLFKQNGISTIINLQEPNEHANCGPPLDKSGFSYDPKTMMDNQIYFYNFHWKDFSGISPTKLLDIVKVMAFALSQGKVAIHCHAGLGRTGVLISAYLIYTYRCQAQSAINFVRTKRPHSVQSRSQILSLFKFANFISPCFIIYSQVSSTKLKATLPEYLQRQNLLLHGEELRVLRYIPKIVFVICEKLIQLCGKQKYVCHLEENFTRVYLSNKNYESFQTIKQSNGEKSDSDLEEGSRDSPSEGKSLKFTFENNSTLNDGKMELPKSDSLEMEEKYSNLIDSLVEEKSDECAPDLEANDELSPAMLSHHRPSYETIQRSLAKDCTFLAVSSHLVVQDLIDQPRSNPELSNQIFDYQKEINNKPTGWEKLCDESNVEMLCALLLSWFENLDIPVLHGKVARMLEASEDNALKCFFKLDKGTRYTLEYLSRFIIRLSGDEEDNEQRERLLWRVVASLTLKRVRLDTGELIPKEKPMWVELDNAHRIYDFIDQLIRIIINSNDI